MAENKYDSGHVIVPVLHPDSGEVHNIAVPPDIPVADLHSALLDGYAHPEPSREGAVELSPAFRKAAAAASQMAQMGEIKRSQNGGAIRNTGEAGFAARRDGSVSPVVFSPDQESSKGTISQEVSSGDLGIFHTHDRYHQSDPSEADKNAAKKAHTTVWVASKDGLYSVDPSGQVTKVFTNPDWASSKNPK